MAELSSRCAVSGQPYPAHELVPLAAVRPKLLDYIRQEHPQLGEQDHISVPELQRYRRRYLENLILAESGDLDKLTEEVIDSMSKRELVTENAEKKVDEHLTFGQHLADHIATFGGSWTFIIVFFSFLGLWMALNVAQRGHAFDPYPFILLNLMLSCIAAIQAPIIMMSQNRQGEKDRIRGEYDYKIDLKAELEIQSLHDKIDHLMRFQMQKLMELQQLQLDFLEDARPTPNK